MRRSIFALVAIFVPLGASGTASAASGATAAAANLVITLIGLALLLWILGNVLTYYRYDSGGPKGGPLGRQ